MEDTPAEAQSASTCSSESGKEVKKTRGPIGRGWHAFARQKLKGSYNVPSLRISLKVFSFLAVLLLVGGILFILDAASNVELKVRYDDIGVMANLTNKGRQDRLLQGAVKVNVTLHVTETMKAPVYVYYQLDDFYQTHKRYVRSISWPQLHGDAVTAGDVVDCIPRRFADGIVNPALPNNGIVRPCGLVAWSLFNDTFSAFQVTSEQSAAAEDVVLDDSSLVWKSVREDLFANVEPQSFNENPGLRGGAAFPANTNLSSNEHFMVWMRIQAKPTAHKYWGKINRTFRKGDNITLTVENNYNTYGFGGKKWVVITDSSNLTGRNPTFGVVWLMMGCISALAVVVYGWVGRERLRLPGRHRDPTGERTDWLLSQLSWNKRKQR